MKLNDFLLLLNPSSAESYLAGELEKASLGGIVLNALVAMFFFACVNLVYSIFGGWLGNVVFALVLFISVMALGTCIFITLAAALFAIARWMGGSGSALGHIHLQSIILAGLSPIFAIMMLGALIPYAMCIFIPLILVPFLYCLLLQHRALMVAHRLDAAKSLAALLLHIALIIGIMVLLYVGALLVGWLLR